MGIDIDGGMIVGAHGSDLPWNPDSDLHPGDWVESMGMVTLCEYYDGGFDNSFFGFHVRPMKVSEMDDAWLYEIKDMAREFENITGVDAYLIGAQDVT